MGVDSIWMGSGRWLHDYTVCMECVGPARDLRARGIGALKEAVEDGLGCFWFADDGFVCVASLLPSQGRAVEGS